MHQLQHTHALAIPPPSSQGQIAILSHQGKDFIVMPADVYRTQQTNRWGWLTLAASGGMLVGTVVAIALVMGGDRSTIPQAPVIIEKPVAVPQTIKPNCIAFCGNE